MSATPTPLGEHHAAGQYEIRLQGHLDARWAAWFEGMSLCHDSNGTTILSGPVADQAALHGLLRRVRDLGLPLLSVMQVDPTLANAPDVHGNTDHRRSNKETDR